MQTTTLPLVLEVVVVVVVVVVVIINIVAKHVLPLRRRLRLLWFRRWARRQARIRLVVVPTRVVRRRNVRRRTRATRALAKVSIRSRRALVPLPILLREK